jgi:hypothetical protein
MDFKLEYKILNEPHFLSKTYATLNLKEKQL